MNHLIFIAGFIALILFIGLTSSDLVTRRQTTQDPAIFTNLEKDEEAHGMHPEGHVKMPGVAGENPIEVLGGPKPAGEIKDQSGISTAPAANAPTPASPAAE